MATHSNILAWNIQWTEESGGLQFKGSQSVRHDRAHMHACMHTISSAQSLSHVSLFETP